MEDLLNAAVDLATLLSPSRVETIAERLRYSTDSEYPGNLYQLVNEPNARAALDRVMAVWKHASVSGETLSGVLMGASVAHRRAQSESTVELVLTGPTTPFVATRRTEQVLLDLIDRAKNNLFLISFVVYDVPSIVDALNAATARNVDVQVLLEASMGHGGSLDMDPISLVRRNVPAAHLYTWADRSGQFAEGRVHAKVAVADGNTAFLTSANLTGHALEKNMEAGVVITGGDVPLDLREHFQALFETRVIQNV